MTHDPMPLDGLLVLDLSQFLAGPYAGLRLGELGARVIKIERPDGGDLCRRLYLTDTEIGGDSTLFHAINRGKESVAADLKDASDLAWLKSLIGRADVLIQNFRPGVIERLGLDPASVKTINPRLVYASITGYGSSGPWVGRPGQDLLAQARSGIMWLNGDEGQGPVPFGLAVADMLAGANAVQGVLAALVRRGVTGAGTHVETSLLESVLDLQFEVLTTYLNDGRRVPRRSSFRSAHAYLAAPYGVYETADGYLALAMTPISKLVSLLELGALRPFADHPDSWFTARDDIKIVLAGHLKTRPTSDWLAVFEPGDVWAAKVMTWPELLDSDAFSALDLLQTVDRDDGVSITTTRAPLKVDGQRPSCTEAAPRLGQHSGAVRTEFPMRD